MANEAGAKAYVRSLSLPLHEELKSHGIHVTVLPPASIEGELACKALPVHADACGL
jgi:short-subunit dehydrogenase